MDFFLPLDLEEALETKSRRPDCVPIAGGTDLMVDINFGRRSPSAVIDLTRISALREWTADDHRVFMGCGVTYERAISDMPSCPPLADASRTIGSPQIRNRGTIGGNLGTASPAGDALPVLAAFDAEILVASSDRGQRFVRWDEFLVGPRRNSLEDDELILGTRWNRVQGTGIFSKVGPRNAMVIAIASLCLVLDKEHRRSRIAVGSVAPTVIRLPEAEAIVDEVLARAGSWEDAPTPLDPTGIDEAAAAVRNGVSPIDDVRGRADYRRHACGVLLRRALSWAVDDLATKSRTRAC